MSLSKTAISVAIVAVLLSGVALVASETVHHTNDREIDVISRVNEEGSMLVIRTDDNAENYLTIDKTGDTTKITISESQREYWGKKVIGTPGITTIQHKMIENFVISQYSETYEIDKTGLGLKFEPYKQGQTLEEGVVYYDTTFTNKSVWDQSTFMDAGIIWESVCSAIIYSDPATGKEMLNTADLSPGHACCVIAGNHTYLSNHEETVVQFLAGYIEAVDNINTILENRDTDVDSYDQLVSFVKKITNTESDKIAQEALDNIRYTYGFKNIGDTDDAPLASLRGDVIKFATQNGLIEKIRSMGYTGNDEQVLIDYANTIVNDKYLSEAKKGISFTERDAQMNVAFIKGDIHQIALQYGMERGFFKEHKITINIFQSPNGAGVATSIQNNAANIGFMGLPPITLVTVNSSLNVMRECALTGMLTDENGNGLANADFELDAFGHTYTGTTDGIGAFSLKVLNGTFASGEQIIKVKINNEWKTIDMSKLERIDKDTDLGVLMLKGGA